MFKLQNGWTKERMLQTLLTKNNGSKASVETPYLSNYSFVQDNSCVYETKDGNRCAAGCFFPAEHPALKVQGSISRVVQAYPDIKCHLPLEMNGMRVLQSVHDGWRETDGASLHDAFRKFVANEVT